MTPEQAKAELARRELARRELSRRQAAPQEPAKAQFKMDAGKAFQDTMSDPMLVSKAISGQIPQAFMENVYQQPREELLNRMNLTGPKRAAAGFGIDVAAGFGPNVAAGVSRGVAKTIARPVQKAGEGLAGRLINQIIKPGKAQFNYGRNPGQEVAKQGITAFTKKGLEKKIGQKLGKLNSDLDKSVNSTVGEFSIKPAFKTLYDELVEVQKLPEIGAESAEQINKLMRDVANLAGSKQVPASKLLEIKRRVGDIPSWSAQDPKLGTLTDVSRKLYRSLDSIMDEAVPGSKDLNSSVSNLIGARDAMSGGMARDENKAFVGLLDRIGPTGVGGAVGMAGGGVPGGVVGALTALGLSKLVNSIPMKTGAAKNIYGVSKLAGKAAGLLEKAEGPDLLGNIMKAVKPKRTVRELALKK